MITDLIIFTIIIIIIILLDQWQACCCSSNLLVGFNHRRRINTEEKAKVVAAAWGTECIQFLAALAILHQDSLKKRIRIITATLRNGCFEKLETIPNIKMDVLPKTFVQIILAAYWLMRHSRTSPPNQQRRHLPSLLYLFFFYMG